MATTLDKASPRLYKHVTPSPTQRIKGKSTRTDREPMSTGEYKQHIHKYDAHRHHGG